MKKLLLCLVVFTMGCATGVTSLLRLQDRELLVHPDKTGLAYPYKVQECVWKSERFHLLGKKCSMVKKMDFYDFTDKNVRQRLIDAGFSCKSSARFKY